MPTLLRIDGYSVQIFTDDHLPPHVHVFARGCELVVNLNCAEEYVSIRENNGFKNREIRDIVIIVQANRLQLCEGWEQIHGDL
jgi:hypothetical protein